MANQSSFNQPMQIFLCHAEEDKEIVWHLYDKLVEEGAEVWLDKRSILPGQTWEKAIRNAVKKSDVVLVCLSRKFNQKGFRQKEVRWALDEAELMLDEDIYIIPVRLEACSVPEALSNRQWVDLFSEERDFNRDNYELLLRALREKAKIAKKSLIRKNSLFNLPKPKPKTPIQAKETNKKPLTEKVKKDEQPTHQTTDGVKEYRPISAVTAKPTPILFPKPKRKWNPTVVAALIGAFATIFAAILGFPPLIEMFKQTPSATISPTNIPQPSKTRKSAVIVSITPTLASTSTQTQPIATPTKAMTLTVTSQPTMIVDEKGIEMMLVPAGEFIMGANNSVSDVMPERKFYVNAFYMDKYEVSNERYDSCVRSKVCTIPKKMILDFISRTEQSKWVNESPITTYETSILEKSYYTTMLKYPVVYVDWYMAKSYCEWRGMRLPTEAEWERAARGLEGMIYTWGNNYDCRNGNFGDAFVKISGEYKTVGNRVV